jgi:hypothetical protein
MSVRIPGFGVLVVLVVLTAGCGGSAKVVVKGTVTLDGNPLEEGAINFFPADGSGTTAGGVISGGNFSVPVPAGSVIVRISASKVIRREPMYAGDPKGPMKEIRTDIIPAKYNAQSELKLDVKSGMDDVKYDLTSK